MQATRLFANHRAATRGVGRIFRPGDRHGRAGAYDVHVSEPIRDRNRGAA